MKKTISLVLLLATICTIGFCFVACTQSTKEDQFLGTWITSSGNDMIMYTFSKDADGNYSAVGGGWNNGTRFGPYLFDRYSASDSVLTFYQDGKSTKHYYSFKGEYLYIDNLEFEKDK